MLRTRTNVPSSITFLKAYLKDLSTYLRGNRDILIFLCTIHFIADCMCFDAHTCSLPDILSMPLCDVVRIPSDRQQLFLFHVHMSLSAIPCVYVAPPKVFLPRARITKCNRVLITVQGPQVEEELREELYGWHNRQSAHGEPDIRWLPDKKDEGIETWKRQGLCLKQIQTRRSRPHTNLCAPCTTDFNLRLLNNYTAFSRVLTLLNLADGGGWEGKTKGGKAGA